MAGTSLVTLRNLHPVATLLLVATLLAASIPAAAGTPKAQGWNASQAPPGGPILDLAGSDALDFFAVGTGDTPAQTNPTTGTPTTSLGDNDFYAYNFSGGRYRTHIDEPAIGPRDSTDLIAEKNARRNFEGTRVVAASPDGRYIAGGANFTGADNVLMMDVVNNVTRTAKLSQPITALAFSADGQYLAVATGAGTTGAVHLFRAPTGQLLSSLPTDGPMASVAISGDGLWVVAGGHQVLNGVLFGSLTLYGRDTGELLSKKWNTTLRTPNEGINHVRISRPGTVFVAATQTGIVLAYGNAGENTGAPGRHTLGMMPVTALDLSHDGRVAAAGNATGVTLFNVGTTGSLSPRWTHVTNATVTDLSLSADGTYLAAAAGGRVQGFHTETSAPIWALPTTGLVKVHLSANGTRVVAASAARAFAFDATRLFVLSIARTAADTDYSVTLPGRANTPVRVMLRLFNDGTVSQTFTLSAEVTNGLTVAFDAESLTVRPGETAYTNATLTPGNVGSGNLTAVLTAAAPFAESQRVTVALAMAPTLGFLVDLAGEATREIGAGRTDEIRLTLHNLGNVPASVTVQVRQTANRGGAWNATLDGPADGTTVVPPGTSVARTVTVSVPGNAQNGTLVTFQLLATANGATLERSVAYRVNPFSAFTFSLDGPSRLVEPGRAATYDLTVVNTGTVDGNVSVGVSLARVPTGAGWNVNVEEPTFPLKAGASRTVKVTVTVPATAKQGQSLQATLNLSLLEKPGLYQQQEIFVSVKNPAPRPPKVTEQNETPGASAVLVLGLLGAAAFALRRKGVRPQ